MTTIEARLAVNRRVMYMPSPGIIQYGEALRVSAGMVYVLFDGEDRSELCEPEYLYLLPSGLRLR